MTTDFRASQIQTNKIITSGSTGTGAKLVFYDISAQNTASLNQGVINPNLFNTSSIGTDVFLYVSGSKTFGTTGVSVFGGALYVSGSFNQGGQNSTASGIGSHAEGDAVIASGLASHAEGLESRASGDHSHAEGTVTIASGLYSHAEGNQTISPGDASHSEGFRAVASGSYSHAEGQDTVASGSHSHAEGQNSIAYATGSHAEGRLTKAFGEYSHSEGYFTAASGTYSHAGGLGTVASGSGQTVFGGYNREGNTDSLFIIGNGQAGEVTNTLSDIFLVNPTTVMIGSGTLGEDVFLFVTGSISSKNSATRGVGLFAGDVHISGNLTVGGSAPGGSTGSLFRLELADYVTVSSVSSTAIGQVIFPANEFTGSITLRGIISTTDATATGSVRLYNVTSGSYVHIGGPGLTHIPVIGITPTIIQSVDLFGATNFYTGSQAIYELQASCSNASFIASFGGFEVRPSGSFTGVTTFVTGAAGAVYWTSPSAGFIFTTGSANISGSLIAGVSGAFAPTINTTMYGSVILATAGTASISSSTALNEPRGWASAIMASEDTSIADAACSTIIGSYRSQIRVIDSTNFFRVNQASIVAGLYDDITDASTSAIVGSSYSSISGTLTSGRNMTILGGTNHHISRSAYSSIAGGYQNVIRQAEQSGIIAGYLNELRGREAAVQYNSVIVGGESNYVGTKIEGTAQVGQASWGVIAGGFDNTIENSYSSFIGAGETNFISGRGVAANGVNAIIGGTTNSIYSSSNSTIVGSSGGSMEYANNSIILGGTGNTIFNTSALSNVNIFGFNWAMAQASNTTAIGDTITAHKLLISASNGIYIGGRTEITGAVAITGSLTISYPGNQGAAQSPSISWKSSYGQETATIWSNDTLLANTGVLSITATSSGSNDGLMLLDGKNKIIYNANTWHHFDINANLLSPNKGDVFFEVSGAVGSKGTTTRGTALFRGDLHVSGNITNDGFTNGRFVITGTTADAIPVTLWTFTLSASALYDIDLSIVAAGTSSGFTKRFKRNAAVSNYNLTSSLLQDSIFVPVSDVSGSTGAANWDVGLRTTGSVFYVDVTGSAATSVRWVLRSEYNFGGST